MATPRRILVFRLGSIGDFVIALPCFRLIRQTYPSAEIVLLTNLPANNRIVPAEAVLRGTGLVDRYVRYSGGTREIRHLYALKKEIVSLAPDMLIYLTEPRGGLSVYRDYLFFRWCEIPQIVGLAPFEAKQWLVPMANRDLREQESHRLGRQLISFGAIDFGSRAAWDLNFSAEEQGKGQKLLEEAFTKSWLEGRRLLGFSVGTKQAVNDWGDTNWRVVLEALASLDFGMVIVGGAEDRSRSDLLTAAWRAPVLNLCGKVSPRLSAAVLSRLRLLLCHDSGPMHLAAAVGTPCIAVFSRRNPPGKWFPSGAHNRIFYPTARSGTIASIQPRQVIVAAVDAMGSGLNSAILPKLLA